MPTTGGSHSPSSRSWCWSRSSPRWSSTTSPSYGNLPFKFRSGPLRITPWEPLLVLFLALIALVAVPLAWHRVAPAGDTFSAQAAENRRNSVFLSAAIVVVLTLTTYIVAIVVSLRTSVGLAVAAGAVAVGAASTLAAFRMGDRALLRLSSARPLTPDDGSPLEDVVRELAIAADIPAPRLALAGEDGERDDPKTA
jgi:hypothetical protein